MRCLRVQRSHSSMRCLPLFRTLSLHLSLAKCALLRLQKCRFSYTFLLPACYYCQLLLPPPSLSPPALCPSPSLSGLHSQLIFALGSCMLFWQLVKASRTLVKCKWNACIAMKCCPIIYGLLSISLPLSLAFPSPSPSHSLYALYFDSKQWICVQIASSIA